MEFAEHNNTIIIKVPVTAEPLNAAMIKQGLQDAGYGRCFFLQNQLDNLLVEYQQLQQKVKALTLAEYAKVLNYPIAEKRAAQLSFELSDDKMTAWAIITAAWGGSPISANDLVKAAQQFGIIFGFNKEQIIQLVLQASRAEPGSRLKIDIAQGRQVKAGKNSWFEPLITDMVRRRNQPLVESEGKADLRDFGAIPSVAKGQSIMRRHPPTAGEAGVDVTGVTTAPTPGMVIEWQLAGGVELSPDDADLLLAAQDGLPRAIENGATVDDVFTVNNVDLASGHIIFKGSVVITGNVIAGMKVVAGGNVFVKGVMEGALIEAGGDITIAGSIIGHQLNNAGAAEAEYSTVLKAAGNIHCHIAQYSAFYCQGELEATKYLMHCQVEAERVTAGTADKLTGKIVGGHYLLGQALYCGQLGSPSSGVVFVKLNRRLNPLLEQQETIRAQLAPVRKAMDEIKQKIDKQKKLLAGQVDDSIKRLEQEFEEQKQLAKALISEVRALEELRLQIVAQLQVKVSQQLFSAVEFQFGKEIIRSRREYGPSLVNVQDGHPAINPL
jgi:uncharacterized protein (DUF342 family)